METGELTVLSCHACPTRQRAFDALIWQRTPQPPASNAAGGLTSGRRLATVGHVAAPDPGVDSRAHRETWRLRTPARVGERRSGGRPCGTRGGARPWGRRPRPQGLVRAPDPCPNRVWPPGPPAGEVLTRRWGQIQVVVDAYSDGPCRCSPRGNSSPATPVAGAAGLQVLWPPSCTQLRTGV